MSFERTFPNLPGRADPQISDAAFSDLSEILEKRTGIVLQEGKRSLAVSRLSRRLARLGLESFEEYCELLDGPAGDREAREMVQLLTTNVTRFFREDHHFDSLRTALGDRVARRSADEEEIRVWSAGCSSGEEAYSIAMVVLDLMPSAIERNVRILATDIDESMLAQARLGQYTKPLQAASDHPLLERFLATRADAPDVYEVAPDVRRLVQFAELNLLKPWPMKGLFDVIFCRNVAIYFSSDTQKTLWPRFAGALKPGGKLMIGHSERITGPATRQLISDGVTQYRRVP